MSAGITITPGSFNPPATPVETMGVMTWPRAAVGAPKKIPLQWHSLPWTTAADEAFDDSPMEISPFAMGYGELLFGTYRSFGVGRRYLPMDIQWRDMPVDRTIEVYNVISTTSEEAAGDGQMIGDVRLTLAVARDDGNPTGFLTEPQSDYLDGRAYAITEQAIIDSITVSSVLWNFHVEMYLQVRVRRTSDNALLKTFTLAPQIAAMMTAEFNPAAATDTLPASGRALRIAYADGDYTIQTPEGFSY